MPAVGAFETKRNGRAWRLRSGWDILNAKYTASARAWSRTQNIKEPRRQSHGSFSCLANSRRVADFAPWTADTAIQQRSTAAPSAPSRRSCEVAVALRPARRKGGKGLCRRRCWGPCRTDCPRRRSRSKPTLRRQIPVFLWRSRPFDITDVRERQARRAEIGQADVAQQLQMLSPAGYASLSTQSPKPTTRRAKSVSRQKTALGHVIRRSATSSLAKSSTTSEGR